MYLCNVLHYYILGFLHVLILPIVNTPTLCEAAAFVEEAIDGAILDQSLQSLVKCAFKDGLCFDQSTLVYYYVFKHVLNLRLVGCFHVLTLCFDSVRVL